MMKFDVRFQMKIPPGLERELWRALIAAVTLAGLVAMYTS